MALMMNTGMEAAKAAYHVGPRYHFSASRDAFFARAPYRVKGVSGYGRCGLEVVLEPRLMCERCLV